MGDKLVVYAYDVVGDDNNQVLKNYANWDIGVDMKDISLTFVKNGIARIVIL